jgi:hypothetical protein
VEADKGSVKGDSMAVDGVNEGTIALSLIQFYLQYSHLLIHDSIVNSLVCHLRDTPASEHYFPERYR